MHVCGCMNVKGKCSGLVHSAQPPDTGPQSRLTQRLDASMLSRPRTPQLTSDEANHALSHFTRAYHLNIASALALRS